MSEPASPTPEERLLSNLNQKQLELVVFYLLSQAEDDSTTIGSLALDLQQKMQTAQYKPSGFHIVEMLMSLATCMEQHGGTELAEQLHSLVGKLPSQLP